jgi:thiol:disulfide interchange protein DsbD
MEAFLPPSHSGWVETYQRGLQLARATGRPLFINFTGVTCTNCRWMEKNMFPRTDVAEELKGFITVELFTDRQVESDRNNQALQKKLAGTVALPVYLIVGPDEKVIRKFESSTRDKDEFLSFLRGSSSRVAKS